MGPFQYRDSELCCEDVSLRALAAVAGTPAYVYSKAALLESLAGYARAFHDVPHVVCYSVKANSNLGVLSVLAKAGAGADIVSGGELTARCGPVCRPRRSSSRAWARAATRCGRR
jgi:diaminopimelate decarboxylase